MCAPTGSWEEPAPRGYSGTYLGIGGSERGFWEYRASFLVDYYCSRVPLIRYQDCHEKSEEKLSGTGKVKTNRSAKIYHSGHNTGGTNLAPGVTDDPPGVTDVPPDVIVVEQV